MMGKPKVQGLKRTGGRCEPVARPCGSAPERLMTNQDGPARYSGKSRPKRQAGWQRGKNLSSLMGTGGLNFLSTHNIFVEGET